MTAVVAFADVDKGTELPSQTFTLTRADLIRYAGASGDFNIRSEEHTSELQSH